MLARTEKTPARALTLSCRSVFCGLNDGVGGASEPTLAHYLWNR